MFLYIYAKDDRHYVVVVASQGWWSPKDIFFLKFGFCEPPIFPFSVFWLIKCKFFKLSKLSNGDVNNPVFGNIPKPLDFIFTLSGC